MYEGSLHFQADERVVATNLWFLCPIYIQHIMKLVSIYGNGCMCHVRNANSSVSTLAVKHGASLI